METIFIRRCVNGKTYVAAANSDFPGLKGRKCPFTGGEFEEQVKDVDEDRAEIMGLNFPEAVKGIKKDGLFFGKFKINLGATMIIN
ncbi:MAG: hypothetical protein V1816_05035 [Pseudomonadota bacterium]